jgi:two-component system CheB/CheR fusion protein
MSAQVSFPIVGIGASAGGVEALEGFFHGLPDHPGIGIVIVTHLGAQQESMLHEIVQRYTQLNVHVAGDGMAVEVDNIYVLAADARISIEEHRLCIRKNTGHHERKPIDIFLGSLAVDMAELSVGIILSGGDGDGALGIKAIKERGGLTLAQASNGFGPQHPDMPKSAIATGFVDFAIPAKEMGAKLVDFARSVAVTDDHPADSRVANDD